MDNLKLNQLVQELHEAGNSIRGIASMLDIDKSKVQRILKSLQTEPRSIGVSAFDTINETNDTFENELYDTARNTPNTAPETAFETGFDTGKQLSKPVSSYNRTAEQRDKSYSSAEVKQLFEQVNLFQRDYVPFVNQMLTLHNGWAMLFVQQYRAHLTTINRLLLTAKFLAYQLNESHENLMVTQVLMSIKTTIENVLSGADPVKNENGLLYLHNKVRSLQCWVDSVSGNFFDPAV